VSGQPYRLAGPLSGVSFAVGPRGAGHVTGGDRLFADPRARIVLAVSRGEIPGRLCSLPMACTTESNLSRPRGADLGSGAGSMLSEVYQRLLKERIIFLGTQVDETAANLICAQLLLLEAEDPRKDIVLYINSPGGSVTDGLAIYDTMQYVACDVSTICLGLAASMGQFLLCAGAPGKRLALPHSRILMHQPSGQVRGAAADIAIEAEQIAYLKKMMAERIAHHTGQPVERIEADSERDRWFTAEEAKEYGFIDHVIDRSALAGAAT
jgi:ATP-dependent Clp protease protease subunit